jgi:uncharacterized protein YegP (UPF0339 family)
VSDSNKVETYKRSDGKWAWRITAKRGNLPDAIIATDGGQGYENEADALNSLFSVFFGTYDTSFLAAHNRWAETSGAVPEVYVRQSHEIEDTAAEE